MYKILLMIILINISNTCKSRSRSTDNINSSTSASMLNKMTYVNRIKGKRFNIPLQSDQLHSVLDPLSQTWAWVCSAAPAGPPENSSASADPHHAPLGSAASVQFQDSTRLKKTEIHSHNFVGTLFSELTSVLHGHRDTIIFILLFTVFTLCALIR